VSGPAVVDHPHPQQRQAEVADLREQAVQRSLVVDRADDDGVAAVGRDGEPGEPARPPWRELADRSYTGR
jgi:hypothetical protein